MQGSIIVASRLGLTSISLLHLIHLWRWIYLKRCQSLAWYVTNKMAAAHKLSNTLPRKIVLHMFNKLGHSMDNGNKFKWIIGPHGNWKNLNSGGCFGATSSIALPIQPILLKKWAKWAELAVLFSWRCKTAPTILIFFNCHNCRFFIWACFHCPLSAPIFHT